MEPRHLVVMGVAGCGKTTIASMLADELNYAFAEGDDFHSDENREKMRSGVPLDDDDRGPWLAAICAWMTAQARSGASTVVTCSALKKRYREALCAADGTTVFVHVAPPAEVTGERIERRKGHYMPRSLLRSQLASLECLAADEPGFVVPGAGTPPEILSEVLERLERPGRSAC